jgi:CSLREA domain-containing protein
VAGAPRIESRDRLSPADLDETKKENRNMSSTRWILPVALAAAALTVSAAPLEAAVFVPTKGADTFDGACDSDCSLREAVAAANANPGTDVILLGARVYTLTRAGAGEDAAATGDLDVTEPVIIVGDGAASTVLDGGGLDRVFDVFGSDASLELSDVTLRNGSAAGHGGAILNRESTVSLTRAILAGNLATGFGGGVYNEGEDSVLQAAASTFSGNLAGGGGGALATVGVAELVNCTLSANRAAGRGGALYVYIAGEATVRSSSVADNQSDLQGGGIYSEPSAFIGVAPVVSNSIVARNTAPANPDCAGSVASGGFNLIANGTGCQDFKAANHDLAGSQASPLDAKLGTLGENGGPTPTYALLDGSPAINGGNPAAPGDSVGTCAKEDQRGATRPAGGACDIGAVERTNQCVKGGGTLCLNQGRFRLTATFKTGTGQGDAKTETLTGDTGYFWFFDPANVEVTVKVLTGCGLNNRYWVFAAGLTNVEVTLTVTDTQTGVVKTYKNPANTDFKPILDTNAFNTCP